MSLTVGNAVSSSHSGLIEALTNSLGKILKFKQRLEASLEKQKRIEKIG